MNLFSAYFRAKFCKRKKEVYEKNKFYFTSGKRIIDQQLTYDNYLRLQTNFENLKNLILSKEKRIMFDIISLPVLSYRKPSAHIE